MGDARGSKKSLVHIAHACTKFNHQTVSSYTIVNGFFSLENRTLIEEAAALFILSVPDTG